MKKRTVKHTLALLLALAMVIGLAACGPTGGTTPTPTANPGTPGESQTPVTPDPTVLNANTQLDAATHTTVTTIDPFTNENNYIVMDMLYLMLFTRDGFGGELQYGLANGYEQVDPFTYKIFIRDNVVDSKGNPTTAEDVAWSYNYCKENGNIAKTAYVESCEVTGENEVTLVLNSDALEIFEDVTTAIWVVSQKTYESCNNNMSLMGYGATGYEVVSFNPGSDITLTRTADWWGDDCDDVADQYARNVGTIHLSFITEAQQLQTGLEMGVLQLAFQVNSLYSSDFQDMPGYKVLPIPANTAFQLVFNCTDNSICKDLLIRQAIAYCADRTMMVNSITYGMGVALPSLGSNLFSGYQTKWESEDYYDYNIDKAKELLAQAGYNGEEIHLMVVANNNNQGTAASILQAACIEAGMNMKIDTYETPTFIANRPASKGAYDVFLYTAASSGYISGMFRYYLDAEEYGGATINGIEDSKLQELVEKACNVETMSDETIDELHQYVKDNCYIIGLISVSRDCVYTDGIEAVYVTGHDQIAPNATVLGSDWSKMAD